MRFGIRVGGDSGSISIGPDLDLEARLDTTTSRVSVGVCKNETQTNLHVERVYQRISKDGTRCAGHSATPG